tara:strand:+ start:180 stop:335 length:156 start_codon:yes stop_codon:yes gene_type:complete
MSDKLLNRAEDKSNLGAGFSSDMSREEIKAALKIARSKAKAFHKNSEVDGL